MIRWIAFDDETADAVMTRFRRGAAEIQFGDPLDSALALGQPSLLVLPSPTPGRVLLARCTPKAKARAAAPLMPPAALPNAPVFNRRKPPQPVPPVRKWWQWPSA